MSKANPSEGEAFYRQVVAPCRWVVGLDEVGTGAFAGPIYMAATVVAPSFTYSGLCDSKDTTERSREEEHDRLVASIGPGRVFVACHSSTYLDRKGLHPTLLDLIAQLIDRAAATLSPDYEPSLFVIDGKLGPGILQVPNASLLIIPKADTFVPACMASANIAKVWRDRYMRAIEQDEPAPHEPPYRNFGFSGNKGYGTKQHQLALERFGVTNEHRLSYRPVGAIAEARRRRPCG
jgi:ribonuclease HII